MQLDRFTVCQVFKIQSPVWNGGKRIVGLARNRIGKHNEIRFLYRRKSDGQLSIPDVYYFDGDSLKEWDYKTKTIGNTELVLIPFTDLEILERV